MISQPGKLLMRFIPYNREVLEISAALSKGYSKDFAAELGLKFKSCNGYGLNLPSINLSSSEDNYYNSHVQVASLFFNFRWDTRKNYINPQNGFVIELDNEIAHDILKPPEQNFYKTGLLLQNYWELFLPHLILANRLMMQANFSDISYLLKLPLGGAGSIRGLPQDRYLCESLILFNSELRFPIWWKIGGIAGADIGNSDSTPNWIFDPVVGLRFYMNNFVVRADAGFGNETRFYFNFGHIF